MKTANLPFLDTDIKNAVLRQMIVEVGEVAPSFLQVNQEEVDAYKGEDQSMYDRLVMDEKKVEGMITSLQTVLDKPDPVGQTLYSFTDAQGMKIENKTAPFGKILIIYESRPDVTVEAAVIAFKSGNQILLKGGKESRRSNLILVECWHRALASVGLSTDWVTYLDFNRQQMQDYLKSGKNAFDLVVPRGGEKLIAFVKEHANAPVLVSGRGNNFMYVHKDADFEMVMKLIENAKFQKISACNALDKLLLHAEHPEIENMKGAIGGLFRKQEATLLNPDHVSEALWEEEFLAKKMLMHTVDSLETAIKLINAHSGKHSAIIATQDAFIANSFMQTIDCAAVYHNASSRFTDGGQFGLGAELAISTDKLHHRGPLGLEHLVSNKWFIQGNGQVRL